MRSFSRQFVVALTLALVQVAVGSAQDEAKPDAVKSESAEPVQAAKPTRAELRDKQLDVSLEARDIERVLSKLKRASDLAKERITEAAKTAESASTSLEKGDSKAARAEAQETAEKFKEIVRQLEALLKEETPQRIAEARQLAQRLAKAEREFAEKFQGALNPPQTTSGKGKVDPKSQVKPLTDPDMKMQGSQGKAQQGGGGKNGKKNEDDKNSEKKDADGKNADDKNGEKPEPKIGDADQPGEKGTEPRKDGKNGGDKPMPDGAGAGKDQDKKNGTEKNGTEKNGTEKNGTEKNGTEKKTGAGDKPDGMKDDDKKKAEGGSGNVPKGKPPGSGIGKDKDETKTGDDPKPEGSGAGQKNKDEKKPGEDQDGSGGDKPDDKRRDGSGGDSNADRRAERDGNSGAGMTAEQRREMVANRADQLAESGKTLQDVLNEIAKSTEPGDKEAVAKIQEVLKEINIDKLVTEMGQIANMIRSTKDDDAKLSSLDVAERLEIMAQRLDGAYRVIVAPQAEELRKIEQALADLRDQLEKLETPSQVAAWHREVRDLLDKLEKLGVSPKDREFLEKEMEKAGFGLDMDRTKRGVNWGLVNGYYAYPVNYTHALVHLQEDIQERIQTLILGDLGNVSDEAIPPKYQELVERYYEVLSRTSAGKSDARKPKPEMKAKSK